MNSLFNDLEYVCACIDDHLFLSSSTFKDHPDKLGKGLQHLQDKGLCINTPKSTFATEEVEYLGYTMTHDGTKPKV